MGLVKVRKTYGIEMAWFMPRRNHIRIAVNSKSTFTFLPTRDDKYNGTLSSQIQEIVPVDSSFLLPVTKRPDRQTTILYFCRDS